jgi:glycine cleavage system H protein
MHEEYTLPDDVLLAETHEYIRLMDDDRVRVGISEYAAAQLGDVVFVDLPEVGQSFEKGESFGSIESVKAQSDLYLPVAGEILAVNTLLTDSPEMVNEDPYNGGWLVEIQLSNPAERQLLLEPRDYLKMIEEAG